MKRAETPIFKIDYWGFDGLSEDDWETIQAAFHERGVHPSSVPIETRKRLLRRDLLKIDKEGFLVLPKMLQTRLLKITDWRRFDAEKEEK